MVALPLAAPKHGDSDTRLLAVAAVGQVGVAFIVKLMGFDEFCANTMFEEVKVIGVEEMLPLQ